MRTTRSPPHASVARLDPKRGAFEVAETLASLDRLEEARRELERLRASGDFGAEVDRRLALLAFQGGDYGEAQRRFTELATSGEASDAALLYLADIAERDGDKDTALAGYRRLVEFQSLAVAARSRAAALLLEKKERGEALTLLDDYVSEHPDRSFEITITKAHLLAEHGESDPASRCSLPRWIGIRSIRRFSTTARCCSKKPAR